MKLIQKYKFELFQRCEYSCDGVTDHGLCAEDCLCQEYYWSHPLFSLQQAKQDEEEGLHCVQAPSVYAGKSR